MKKVLETILEYLVTDPKTTSVEEVENGDIVTLTIKVAKVDMGRVIGKEGKIIQALRNLLKIKAIKDGKRVELILAEPTA